MDYFNDASSNKYKLMSLYRAYNKRISETKRSMNNFFSLTRWGGGVEK